MSPYVNFGGFRVRADQITKIELTIDVDEQECVLLHYAEGASIILYDEAASEALEWSKVNAVDTAISSLYERKGKRMPRPIHYDQRKNFKIQEKVEPAESPKVSPIERQVALKETVLEGLGTPDDLIEVQVRRLWDSNHFRVNVVREVAHTKTFVDSYFVTIKADGLVFEPPLVKKYHGHDDIEEKRLELFV